ncbi:ArdC family protein [Variovorax sp. YR266]|uniref:ArdC family protein n=1 Tax=Variovorax sp. YR266 TaxID=1884386 RepID=UPI0021095C9A|nr:zincin-like metallopeptidase domain-containing protein [Variovorax sp. YR266]
MRRAVTDRIAAMLAQGESVFRDRWTRAAACGMPRNGRTGAPYRGVNVLLLLDALAAQGYASNVWLTYRQAAGLGAQVRRGERAVLCAQFERGARGGGVEASDRAGHAEGPQAGRAGDASRSRGVLRCEPFWLFNVAQIDGLPPEVLARCTAQALPLSSLSPVERTLRLLCGCDAVIRYGCERAVYLPAPDEIRLPWPESFANAEAHCAAVLRALVHWSGHAGRLGRAFGRRVGGAAWAFEELVAEFGSIFLMGHCGLIGAAVEGHAASSCLDAWLRMLRNDPSAIFAAARHASTAFAFIVAKEMPRLEPLDIPGRR